MSKWRTWGIHDFIFGIHKSVIGISLTFAAISAAVIEAFGTFASGVLRYSMRCRNLCGELMSRAIPLASGTTVFICCI